MELIKQAYQYNEEYLSERKTELKPRHKDRHAFWEGLLQKAKDKNADFQNLSPTNHCWIGKGSGKSGVSFNMVVLNKSAGVEVYLDIHNKEMNKQRFDTLKKHQSEIEKIFGDALNWERLDTKRACRISKYYDEVGLKYKDSWDELQNKMVVKMMAMEKAFEKFVPELE